MNNPPSKDDVSVPVAPRSATDANPQTGRIVSIDVYRGMVMFLMLAELMHLYDLAAAFPGQRMLEWLKFNTTHVAWEGCSLHDLIQPGFTFLVGVAMPFSIASRIKHGGSKSALFAHAVWRSFLLIAIGIVLRSLGKDQTRFTFEDTLTQIGLGYFVVFGIALLSRRVQYAALVALLVGFWGLYAVSPAPPADFDYASVGVDEDWPHHYEGFAARWNKNANVSWQFDTWFLNLFPRSEEFLYNAGGYATLSFIPTMGTMLLGLLAGNWFREIDRFAGRMKHLLIAAAVCLAVGGLAAWLDLCPLVKRIWTPSFTLVSGGLCLAWLAALHWICDHAKWKRWAFPFVVIGANSILIYVMSWTVADPIRAALYRHFGRDAFAFLGTVLIPTLSGAVTIGIMYYVLLWLYRRKVFIKI